MTFVLQNINKRKAGDHLITQRMFYYHHGIYLGNNKVIHYSGFSDIFETGPIVITDLHSFTKGRGTLVRYHRDRSFNHVQTVARARRRLHEDNYNLLLNNCEHFVNWCIYGESESESVFARSRESFSTLFKQMF
ncbi:lecithin retinol acyltransferase family protein [Psychrobacter piscatorii]|uniref:lecithin retinol acyltransferase family protein n=1 Tax=Psychrobacter piscatorii TaxID=554343 RepID=UPI003735854E